MIIQPNESLDLYSALDELSVDELKALVVSLKSRKTIGLYWERDEVSLDRALNRDHICLTNADSTVGGFDAIGDAPWNNLIIEGDNFDVLRLLGKTHLGRIRVILIDPPYNTGNKDWVYNDRYVSKEDRYRSSQWLEFLYARLLLARDLLTTDGVILVCINDENRAKMELLMDELFEGMRIGSFVWKTRSGSNDSSGHNFSVDHEHILVYGRNEFQFGGAAKDFRQYKNLDNDPRGPWKTGDLSCGKNRIQRPWLYYPIQNPATGTWYPANPNTIWRFASESKMKPGTKLRKPTMEEYIRDDKIVWPINERIETFHTKTDLLRAIEAGDVPVANRGRTKLLTADLPDLDFWVNKPIGYGRPWFKRHLRDVGSRTSLVTSWVRGQSEKANRGEGDDVDDIVTARSGTSEDSVKEILGYHAFDFPKPPSLFRELLRFASDDRDIILDFFAGSGTTGHAVLALNDEDDGERSFILVSSTEATSDNPTRNLCRDVCATRVARVINGYEGKEGLTGGFVYLQTSRIAESDLEFDITPEQMFNTLCLRYAGRGGLGFSSCG